MGILSRLSSLERTGQEVRGETKTYLGPYGKSANGCSVEIGAKEKEYDHMSITGKGEDYHNSAASKMDLVLTSRALQRFFTFHKFRDLIEVWIRLK